VISNKCPQRPDIGGRLTGIAPLETTGARGEMLARDRDGGASMTDRQWIDAFAAALGAEPPTDAAIEALLALAGEAAHASQRTAAPVACWLAAVAGRTPDDALAVARTIALRNG
jgi:hypothetical protein